MRPFLLVDVDFTLNPDFSTAWESGDEGERLREAGWGILQGFTMNARPVWLNRHHGIRLLHVAEATGAKLAWATRWHDLANQVISPLLGLPQLPVAPCDPQLPKPFTVIPWLEGRPFVWLDDEEDVISACGTVPDGNGVRVDSATGLVDADFDLAAKLLAGFLQ